jgi:V-type H+-transporting ATPase subunit a
MKMSVILGVLQMTGGIILRGMNAVYFKSSIDFFFEFIPQLIFMLALFGYMIIMIFIKWNIDWTDQTNMAPSIITQLMNIFLKFGSTENKPLWTNDISLQENVQFWLLIISVICVPILLFPKPLILYKRSKQHPIHEGDYVILENEEDAERKPIKSVAQPQHHDESFANIFIHQVIETIEFVLGAISNTASYLRLWALSLAHAQLAKVFFEMALLNFIKSGNLLMVIIGYFIFANITFFVLMCMDLLECFLHTLRLHWVEFQNKFYKADGFIYKPFTFRPLVESD